MSASNIEARAFDSVLKLLGFQTTHARKAGHGLLVVPSNESLSPRQLAEVREFIRKGGDAIVTPAVMEVTLPGDIVTVRDVTEIAHPDRYLRWNPVAAVARFALPDGATLLLQDQPTHQPLAFYGMLGKGRYLALAASFDTASPLGTSRYPYFAEYLRRAFDYHPRVRRPAIEAYFDPGLRDARVAEWQAAGIRIVYAAAWYAIDYARLIEECHSAGIAVYAWLTPPMLDRKFWDDHPEWRAPRTGWRYPMNLEIPAARTAAFTWMHGVLDRYEWDGVNFAELNSDSPSEGAPVTALHRDVLREFANPKLEVMITALDSFSSPRLRRDIGIDSIAIVALMRQFPFTLQVEDAFEHWSAPPDRYLNFARAYARRPAMFDINVVTGRDVGKTSLPSALATGTEFLQLLYFASSAKPARGRVAVYAESTVAPQDWEFAAAALAGGARITGNRIRTPHSVTVDGTLFPAGNHLLLIPSEPLLRTLSCELLASSATGFEYDSPGRCAFVLAKPASRLFVDGAEWREKVLPRGRHRVRAEAP